MLKREITLPIYMPHVRADWPEDAAEEIVVRITYHYTPGSRGGYWEPPHGPEVEVHDIVDAETNEEVASDIYEHICRHEWCVEKMIEEARA